ncbi:MAG TPA: aldehyde dehydrogenase family protein [Casimicrobiaceae bacterium]|nr:aldehyde dehydrogenase family protein [Casimicrobiaceae bacterium]
MSAAPVAESGAVATLILPSHRSLYYGGAWHASSGGREAPVTSPSTGEALGVAVDASAADVDRAVTAARKGFAVWRDVPPQERARAIRKAAAVLREHAEELALIEALDTGNPFSAMVYDVGISADYMELFAGLVTEIKGSTIPIGPSTLHYTLREPLGVVARIGAFNHPLLFVAGKCGAPLAAGNALIVKPSDTTPLTALRIAELWDGIFPAGVFNIVTGGRDAGAALTAHPGVAKIGFIGSVNGGRAVMGTASGTLKQLTLELGGKNALIACADANPSEVADGVVRGMNFRYVTGQSCNSTSRVFLHDAIHDATLPEIVDRVRRIRVGLPTERDTEMGCLSSQAQLDKTLAYIKLGLEGGARLVYGGKRSADPRLARGFFVEPTVFADVTDDMRIAREEIFGPVVSVLRWSNEEDLLARVNALDVGLTCSIWTRDLDRAHRLAARVEAGYVWVNGASQHWVGVPFGGYKQSGMGREESIDELLACTQIKTVNVML